MAENLACGETSDPWITDNNDDINCGSGFISADCDGDKSIPIGFSAIFSQRRNSQRDLGARALYTSSTTSAITDIAVVLPCFHIVSATQVVILCSPLRSSPNRSSKAPASNVQVERWNNNTIMECNNCVLPCVGKHTEKT
ncbi:hypothetical protein DY000_02043772 [Brassica cretica]|uniref:Uncharacterized protein n=1 Tax=Brassica cretica TaxID=69181 RepID=A0ABQ7BB54_BRACR|nr:hypothetical protein DY000_02043772 [Brassica cretica]